MESPPRHSLTRLNDLKLPPPPPDRWPACFCVIWNDETLLQHIFYLSPSLQSWMSHRRRDIMGLPSWGCHHGAAIMGLPLVSKAFIPQPWRLCFHLCPFICEQDYMETLEGLRDSILMSDVRCSLIEYKTLLLGLGGDTWRVCGPSLLLQGLCQILVLLLLLKVLTCETESRRSQTPRVMMSFYGLLRLSVSLSPDLRIRLVSFWLTETETDITGVYSWTWILCMTSDWLLNWKSFIRFNQPAGNENNHLQAPRPL